MSILIDERSRVVVQGITGREGMVRTKLMVDYGTNVVAGVTPGKKGEAVFGVPVFDTVEEAWEEAGPLDVSVIFVPAPFVKGAAFEAIDAGVKLLVIVPDRVPLYDVLEIDALARRKKVRFVGPNTLGMISPGKAVVGMIGGKAATAREWFRPGPVGVISRSGGITSAISYYLTRAGVGLSTVIHVGGDPIIGLPFPELLKEFEQDPETKAVVMFGEIGTSQEETAAELIKAGEFTKPLVAFIGGAAAKSGTRFSHAGAIIEGGRGTHRGKVESLRSAGAIVVDTFDDLFTVTPEIVGKI
ncbi:succinate--CoA ligase subunit alpha [Desulfofundulus thermobenzoicus]|uniref:Succinate--CoA ligase subunit alpha n=1 Tax=Desulfofundulus thermobenzoicus TaxID=29376 RepID=A0A6N7IUL8_9FIRM|nr:CoA-binding protein [Desulfofundulus thermobenzoicus]MQL53137.1 succinate--CoA ligase subunit alpha [Desulfofundulus thermobenzoicus]